MKARSRLALFAAVVGFAAGVIVALIDPFWLDGLHRFVGFEIDVALIIVGPIWIRRLYLNWRRRRGNYL